MAAADSDSDARSHVFERIGDAQVESLTPGVRDLAQQRLPDELVREREPHATRIDRRRDETSAFGFVDGVDQVVFIEIPESVEKVEVEAASYRRRSHEQPLRVGLQGLQPILDRQPDALGNVQVERGEVGAPTAFIQEGLLLEHLRDHFTEEEGIALGRLVKRAHESSRWRSAADDGEQVVDVRCAE